MAEMTCAPPPPSPASWKGTALATGAGVLAGWWLGHKGVVKLAAGVAAVAGAKLLTEARRDAPNPSVEFVPQATPPQDAPPHVTPRQEVPPQALPLLEVYP